MADFYSRKNKGKLGANVMKRVAAGAHLPTSWLFEPAKRPDDTADYCLTHREQMLLAPISSIYIYIPFIYSLTEEIRIDFH